MRLSFPLLLMGGVLCAQTPASKPEPELLTVEGQIQILPVGATQWVTARANQPLHFGDRLRSGEHSRATVRLSDQAVSRLDELSTLVVRPPQEPGKPSLLEVNPGSLYFHSREKPAQQQFRTPLTSGAIRGTEFNLAVAEDGRTVVTLIDGAVTLSNQLGEVTMASGEQGTVEPGKAPIKSPMLEAINIIQWCLYYPGVLDASELELTPAERQAFSASLTAYSSGDLLQAVASLPNGQAGDSDSVRVYRAACLLSAGQARQAETLLASLQTNAPTSRAAQLAAALREAISAVQNQSGPRVSSPQLATEWLAESYYLQAHGQLREALSAARSAVAKSPEFGFGWARVAELELSFGHLAKAQDALTESLRVSPRNAQSLAVKGFILLARGRVTHAQAAFEEAMAVDGALGNAWLGRGLCQIQRGQAEAGRQDLQTAAVLEPQRAILRSYLGKAFSNARDNQRAQKELKLAERLDPNDPTAWLYSALVESQQNEINQAVRDLEESERLNDNRRLFRSRLLLDQDQAVRGANFANVYQDTGILNWYKGLAMSDWSVREASRAVNYDYANFSAHQFLANSYDPLLDPRQINLRYETAWFSELLMANLLAPPGAGNLSEFSAQQPSSRLFQQNHFGASSDTEYLSHGDWLERASQYGNWGPASYAADVEYLSQRGWRPNNDFEQFNAALRAKDQITPHDGILLEGIYSSSKFGDVAQYYNQNGTLTNVPAPSQTFRGKENQWPNFDEPNVFLGYNHEWGPGIHTLFLGGHLTDDLSYSDPQTQIPFTVYRGGQVASISSRTLGVQFDRYLAAYTAELQQIWQTEHQTFVAGGRYQTGDVTASSQVNNPSSVPPLVSQQNIEADLDRYSVYAYETIKPFKALQLTAGVTYDKLRYPEDMDTSPISGQAREIDQVSPKAGFILSPLEDTHFRFAYTRSLGGVFYDTSLRLEPTEVAGFNQAYRSIIPESVVGQVPGTRFTTYGVGLDQSFKSGTYITLAGEILDSEAQRTVGAVRNPPGVIVPVPRQAATTHQSLDYTEQTFVASLSQLLCNEWSVGARYQLSHGILHSSFTDVASTGLNQDQDPLFQQLYLYLNFYHPCGFFSQFQSVWTGQHNGGPTAPGPGDYFWQFNLYAGYRFLHRAAEFRVGLLNLTGQDYMLNPVNFYYDMPRARTLSLSLKFSF